MPSPNPKASTPPISSARPTSPGRPHLLQGRAEKFLAVAQKYLSLDGDEHPLDLESLNAKIDELAGKSMRVLAFGYSPSEMTENAINADTVLIGLVGIRDDVRPEAREAIAEVQKAGIQVVMITGDRLETAVAIAREAGAAAGPGTMWR